MSNNKSPEEIVNQSGYPLQIRLEDWINETYKRHKWKVLVSEHRWVNSETKDEGFIDLVLENANEDKKLVIECKRIIGNWIFLLPQVQFNEKYNIKALIADYDQNNNFFYTYWKDTFLTPQSNEATFCVMETGGKRDSRTLENLSGELLLSLEHLVVEETKLYSKFFEKMSNPSRFSIVYLPVIVTTANLHLMNFDPSKIDIKTGKVIKNDLAPVEFIRFRKNLATSIDPTRPDNSTLDDINRENDRTVFVVQAKSFITFLEQVGNY